MTVTVDRTNNTSRYDGVGTFSADIYRGRTRAAAVRRARHEAHQAGLRVLEVCQVVEQREGAWRVELRVDA